MYLGGLRAGLMPYRPPTACRCGLVVPSGQRCPRCRPSWERPPQSWIGGSTRRWRAFRAAKLLANPECQWPACVRLADEVDHIRPLALGGERYAWHNVQSLCQRHHILKTADDARRVREARR